MTRSAVIASLGQLAGLLGPAANGVNQHAKITREKLESTLKSYQLVNEKIRHLSGEPWSDRHGSNSRN